jgi:hypothetical protein
MRGGGRCVAVKIFELRGGSVGDDIRENAFCITH